MGGLEVRNSPIKQSPRDWAKYLQMAIGGELSATMGLVKAAQFMGTRSVRISISKDSAAPTIEVSVEYFDFNYRARVSDIYEVNNEEYMEHRLKEIAREVTPAIAILQYGRDDANPRR